MAYSGTCRVTPNCLNFLPTKKEWITISLKKKLSFDELVSENRKQILQDHLHLEKIEQNLETKRQRLMKKEKSS